MTRIDALVRTLEEKGLELERLNRELAEREARLRTIFDAEPECVKLLAADGALLEMNPAGLRMIEADSFQQVANQSLAPLIGEAHRPAFRELTERVFRGESGTLEYQLTGLKGGRRWLETHAKPLRDASGAITAMLGITRDITDRKRAEEELRQSEAKFRLLAEESPAGVVIIQDGRFRYVNQALAGIMGYSTEELLAAPSILDLVAEADRPLVRENLRRRVEGEVQHVRFAFHARKKDGSLVDLDVFGSRLTFEDRPAVMSTVLDITARRLAEAALRLSEGRFRRIMESDMIGLLFWNAAGDITEANDTFLRIVGFERDDVRAGRLRWPDMTPPEHWASDERALRDVESTGSCAPYEKDFFRKDGSRVPVLIGGATFPEEPDQGVAFVLDLTERKRAEEAAVLAHRQREDLIASVDGIVWEADADTFRFTFVSPRAERLLGYPRARWTEEPTFWADHIHPDDREAAVRYCEQCTLERRDHEFEYRMLAADGRAVWLRDIVTVAVENGRPAQLRGIMVNITDRKAAETELRRREERFRMLIENAADMIGVINHQGVFRFLSPSADSLLGYAAEDVIGRSSLEFIHPDDVPHTTAALREAVANPATAVRVEHRVRHRDGGWRAFQTIGRSVPDQAADGFIVLNSRDVTDSRLLEDQLRQSQKMEAIGQLAGGIAHDFNNLLTVINGTADLALSNLNAEDPLRADLLEILNAGDRAATLTRQLLAFGRKQIMRPGVVDLNAVVSDMLRMLRRLIGEHIECVFKPAENLASVRADPSQIEQVIMNLVVNARDAMGDGGVLTIDTRNVVLDAAFAAEHPSVVPGPHVMLAITDTGIGMDESTCKRIFEPFFSTKGPAENAGLGLATVYGIVKQSGGSIWVSSEPGRGTTFTTYLPQVEEETPTDRSARSAMATSGTETILIVEDEAAVRQLATRFLQSAGYTVVTASDGAEALLLLERQDQPVHLMLTDVVMPGISGLELAARLASIRPRMKVLYTSGYTNDTILRHGVLGNAAAFIGKPYSKADLSRKVREVLDAPDV